MNCCLWSVVSLKEAINFRSLPSEKDLLVPLLDLFATSILGLDLASEFISIFRNPSLNTHPPTCRRQGKVSLLAEPVGCLLLVRRPLVTTLHSLSLSLCCFVSCTAATLRNSRAETVSSLPSPGTAPDVQ